MKHAQTFDRRILNKLKWLEERVEEELNLVFLQGD